MAVVPEPSPPDPGLPIHGLPDPSASTQAGWASWKHPPLRGAEFASRWCWGTKLQRGVWTWGAVNILGHVFLVCLMGGGLD